MKYIHGMINYFTLDGICTFIQDFSGETSLFFPGFAKPPVQTSDPTVQYSVGLTVHSYTTNVLYDGVSGASEPAAVFDLRTKCVKSFQGKPFQG
jgi:hypothetical protein